MQSQKRQHGAGSFEPEAPAISFWGISEAEDEARGTESPRSLSWTGGPTMKNGGDIDGMDSSDAARGIEQQPQPAEVSAETLGFDLGSTHDTVRGGNFVRSGNFSRSGNLGWKVRRERPVSMRLAKPGVSKTCRLKIREGVAEISDLPSKSSQTSIDDDRRGTGHENDHAAGLRVEGGLPWVDVSQDAERRRTGASTTRLTESKVQGIDRLRKLAENWAETDDPTATVRFRCDVQRSASSRRRSRIWQAEDVSVRRCFPVLIPFPVDRSTLSTDRKLSTDCTGLWPRCEKSFSIAALSVDGRPLGAAHPRAAWSSSGALASAGKLASRFLHERSRRRLAG